jgi:hypothetical protein
MILQSNVGMDSYFNSTEQVVDITQINKNWRSFILEFKMDFLSQWKCTITMQNLWYGFIKMTNTNGCTSFCMEWYDECQFKMD